MVFILYNIYSARGIYCTLYIKRKVVHALSNLQSSLTIYSVQYMWTLSNTVCFMHLSTSSVTHYTDFPQLWGSDAFLVQIFWLTLSIFCWYLPLFLEADQILHSMFMTYSCQTFLDLCKNFSW